MGKILVTPRSFGKTDESPYKLLEQAGYEVVKNPTGQILTKDEMIELMPDMDGIIVGVDPLDKDVLSAAKKLRAIAKYGVGTDNIDKEYCAAHSIPVSITAGANASSVADYTFALIMACARKLTYINEMCHQKNWGKVISCDVYGKTIGILGLGAIGKGVAKRAGGFDMRVMAYDVFWNAEYAADNDIEYAEPDRIFKECDFICLHLPLTEETKNIVNARVFEEMKPNAVLVNTARGGLIDEAALIDALQKKKILGAGIDVFNEEPPANEALYKLDNLIMGSHCAASSIGASEMVSMAAAQNLLRDLK
ncbi:MAG: phosphoglycerate dehydrogenase [Oscillospiraceae bacterium]